MCFAIVVTCVYEREYMFFFCHWGGVTCVRYISLWLMRENVEGRVECVWIRNRRENWAPIVPNFKCFICFLPNLWDQSFLTHMVVSGALLRQCVCSTLICQIYLSIENALPIWKKAYSLLSIDVLIFSFHKQYFLSLLGFGCTWDNATKWFF